MFGGNGSSAQRYMSPELFHSIVLAKSAITSGSTATVYVQHWATMMPVVRRAQSAVKIGPCASFVVPYAVIVNIAVLTGGLSSNPKRNTR